MLSKFRLPDLCDALGSLRILLFAAALMGMTATSIRASDYSYNVIYDFCGVPDCTNGAAPSGKLLMDSSGNLYGTTSHGGAYNNGAIFELKSNAGVWSETVLYSFCRRSGCPDGTYPGLYVMDTAGDLYGTDFGATSGHGIAFELIPNANHSKWKLKTLHRFCTKSACADGYDAGGLTYEGARTGALYDGVSPLYGATEDGGANGGGTAFTLTPVSGTTQWKLKTIYNFCAQNCDTDAWEPGALQDAGDGTFFAVSFFGGHGSDWGSIFRLKQRGRHWNEKVLYSFGTSGIQNGVSPNAMIIDPAGNFDGTASNGGYNSAGVLFAYDPQGGAYSVLHSFCMQGDCPDGEHPFGLATDGSGDFYGATFMGGDSSFEDGGGGVVYALDPTFRVLHAFCSDSQCTDGNYPSSDLLRDAAGNLFGETSDGGAHNGGVIFELSP